MRKSLIAGVLSLAALGFSLPAAAQDRVARFDGGIGVIPTGSTNTRYAASRPRARSG